ncbi:hypothetical protein LLEC1_07175 [Akanthomyces lecanii]|uniref:Uncharacterized protein n=1 Tax=Cordyceps confragosa TaxID=2714763 RepID=A0A179ILZ9_CORDF|nr:hypothetical protein LLEC1_07175 [Akanthomyces lecanii]
MSAMCRARQPLQPQASAEALQLKSLSQPAKTASTALAGSLHNSLRVPCFSPNRHPQLVGTDEPCSLRYEMLVASTCFESIRYEGYDCCEVKLVPMTALPGPFRTPLCSHLPACVSQTFESTLLLSIRTLTCISHLARVSAIPRHLLCHPILVWPVGRPICQWASELRSPRPAIGLNCRVKPPLPSFASSRHNQSRLVYRITRRFGFCRLSRSCTERHFSLKLSPHRQRIWCCTSSLSEQVGGALSLDFPPFLIELGFVHGHGASGDWLRCDHRSRLWPRIIGAIA